MQNMGITVPEPSGADKDNADSEDNVTASTTVEYSHEKIITVDKRFTCATPDVVYLLHCADCKETAGYSMWDQQTICIIDF